MSQERRFTFNNGKLSDVFRQLEEVLQVQSVIDCRRSHLDLGVLGEIMLYEDSTGIDSLIFRFEKQVAWNFEFTGASPATINFFSVAKGNLRLEGEGQRFSVAPLQSVIHGGFGHHAFSMNVFGEEKVLFAITALNKRVFFDDMDCETLDIPEKLLKVVEMLEDVEPGFLFRDIYHLPIVNALQDIVQQENKGLLNSTFAAAKIHEMLFLQLNEYKRQEGSASRRLVRQQDRLQMIKDAEEILISRLQDPPTIPELARMVGSNQQSLKQGFRQVFGETINQHLNNKRLEQAGILIRAGELSLREVAMEVGYNNPGYFSRRFREKYGVSPRYFSKSGQ